MKFLTQDYFFFYANLPSVRKCNKIVLFADFQACARTRIKRNLIYFLLTHYQSINFELISLIALNLNPATLPPFSTR